MDKGIKLELQACFDCTNSSVLEAAATDINDLTDTVTVTVTFVCKPRPSAHTTTANLGSHLISGNCVKPKRRPTVVGTGTYISRPGTS